MRFIFGLILSTVAVFSTAQAAEACRAKCAVCRGYDGPGGACYAGPGGPVYAGPGGACYDGPGGACYAGPGGACYDGPGGNCYDGPGGTGEKCSIGCGN